MKRTIVGVTKVQLGQRKLEYYIIKCRHLTLESQNWCELIRFLDSVKTGKIIEIQIGKINLRVPNRSKDSDEYYRLQIFTKCKQYSVENSINLDWLNHLLVVVPMFVIQSKGENHLHTSQNCLRYVMKITLVLFTSLESAPLKQKNKTTIATTTSEPLCSEASHSASPIITKKKHSQ